MERKKGVPCEDDVTVYLAPSRAPVAGTEKERSGLLLFEPPWTSWESVLRIPEFSVDATFLSDNAGVRIGYRGKNLINLFHGTVERDVFLAKDGLFPYRLLDEAYDEDILPQLRGPDFAFLMFAEVWRELLRQPNGEEGNLLVNGSANVFYVQKEVYICSFDARWCISRHCFGWHFNANYAPRLRPWHKGYRFFTRFPIS